MLVEVDGCVFDADQLPNSHGRDGLDPVARESFVNHLHIAGRGRAARATQLIESWSTDFQSGWPGSTFRIYREASPNEVTLRFHRVRKGIPNWAEEGVEIIEVRT